MGEAVAEPPPRAVPVRVQVDAPVPSARVEVCRNNFLIDSKDVGAAAADFEYVNRDLPADRTWYGVRVRLADDKLAWNSPVWWNGR